MLKSMKLKLYLIHTLSYIHKNSFFFSVSVLLKFEHDYFGCFRPKISVSNNVTYNIESDFYSTYTTETAPDFLHRVIGIYLSHRCSLKISDLKDITCQHYLEQPKSTHCRLLIRKFHESPSQDFEYKWLPNSFKIL